MFAVLGLEVVHSDAEALSSRKGYKTRGIFTIQNYDGKMVFPSKK